MSTAIAQQLALVFMGRSLDTQWASSTANLLNGGQPSVALQTAFYNSAVAEGVFSTSDSPSGLVNDIFQNIFGFGASTFEQTAWGNLITNGTLTKETAAWTIFKSYLGATNVPDAYKLPAQSKLVAMNAYSTELAADAEANLALAGGGKAAAAARAYVSGVTSQATAATAISGVAASVDALPTASAPTYTLTSSAASVNEGGAINFTLAATNVAAGTQQAYTITGVNSADVVGGSLSGVATIGADGKATISVTLAADATTEGAETLTVSVAGKTASATVNDTSIAPVPTYALAADAASVNEGGTAMFTLTTTNVAAGSTFTYMLSGVSAADVVGGALTGTATVGTDGKALVGVTLLADALTEGVETLTIAIANQTASTTVNDTSLSNTSFVLTTALDILTGTPNDDLFNGSFDGAATSTSNLGDAVNGGAGSDTVRITSNAAGTVIPTLTSVESLILNDNIHEVAINVSNIIGLTSLELEQGVTVAAGEVRLTVAAGQSITLDRVTDGDPAADAGADGEIVIVPSSTAMTSLNLNLENVGATTGLTALNDLDLVVDGTSVTTASIASTGINNISFANTNNTITTINFTGAGAVTVQGTTATSVTTVNASAATGAVTHDVSASTGANQTITGGSAGDSFTVDLARNISINTGAGNDTVTLSNPTAGNLASASGAADAINGGDGTGDVLVLTNAGAVALAGDSSADRAVITNFERLRVSDDLNAASFTISNLSSINYLQVGAATTTAAATVSGFASGASVEYRAAADSTVAVTVGMTGATAAGTPNDTLNIVLNSNLIDQPAAGNAFDFIVGVAGINKLNVSTADRDNADGATTRNDGYILTLESDQAVDAITITGDRELAFTSTATTAALETFTASALSGDLLLNLATNGLTQGVVVAGGSGTNTITGTAFQDNITGGARADTITSGNGADVMTGGAGADTFVFAAGSTGGSPSASNNDSITDFAINSDIIDAGAAITIVQNGSAIGGTAAINVNGIATFASTDNTLALRITAVESGINAGGAAAANQVAAFEFGSDSYIFLSDGADGVGANDVLVKLVGITGLTTSTITGGDITFA